jgi:hypothetical protein
MHTGKLLLALDPIEQVKNLQSFAIKCTAAFYLIFKQQMIGENGSMRFCVVSTHHRFLMSSDPLLQHLDPVLANL